MVREAQKVRVEVRVKVRVRPYTLTWINALYIGLSGLFGEWVRAIQESGALGFKELRGGQAFSPLAGDLRAPLYQSQVSIVMGLEIRNLAWRRLFFMKGLKINFC